MASLQHKIYSPQKSTLLEGGINCKKPSKTGQNCACLNADVNAIYPYWKCNTTEDAYNKETDESKKITLEKTMKDAIDSVNWKFYNKGRTKPSEQKEQIKTEPGNNNGG